MNETVVEVKTCDGSVYRHWNIDWSVSGGQLIIRSRDRFTYYAKGQWVYASDVDPE